MKHKEIYLALKDAPKILAKGVPFSYKGIDMVVHKEWNYIQHKFFSTKRYTVSECVTGYAVVYTYPSVDAAIEAAKEKLDDPVLYEKAKKFIEGVDKK